MIQPVNITRPMPPCLAYLGDHGSVMLFYQGEHNRCPSCGATQWYVGRVVATCARCEGSIPIVTPQSPAPDAGPLIPEKPTLTEKEAA